MKKYKNCLFICSLLFILTGCWDSVELNDVSIVTGIAVEKGEDAKYKLTVEVINASEFSKDGGKGNTPTVVYGLEGDSISELADKLNKGLIRKLIYSHTRVLVIDEELAREGILGFLDFLERSGDLRNNFNVMVAKGVKASTIINNNYPVQGSTAIKLSEQTETYLDEWGGDPNIRLTDFITAIMSKGRSPVMTAITIDGDPKKGSSVDNNKKTTPDSLVVIDGLAVFNDDKLLGFMPIEGTRNFLWTKDLNTTSLTIPCQQKRDNAEQYIDIRINYSTTQKETVYHGDTPELKVNITVEGNLQGTQCTHDLSELETYEKYEGFISSFIEQEIQSTIEKVQDDFKVDIFGFGEELERQNYSKFKEVKEQWNEEFTNADVDVQVQARLRRSGIRSESFITEYLKGEIEE